MGRKPKFPHYCPAWFVQAAEGMVRNNIGLKQAALDIGVTLDGEELERISRRPEFKEILRAEANKYYSQVANDPSRSKSTAIGRMWVQAELLQLQGDYDKAAAVLEKLAKLEGWTGSESNVNIFAGLTARDIEDAKDRILAELPKVKQVVDAEAN